MYKITPQQIVAWVTKHFPDFKPRKNGEELRICNPFTDDDGYHFNISVSKGVCHDWRGDEWAGPINPRTRKRPCSFLNFVRLYLNCSYKRAAEAISLASGDTVQFIGPSSRHEQPDGRPRAEEPPLVAFPTGAAPVGTVGDTMDRIVSTWLRTRGITKEMAELYGVHYVSANAIFPYYEYGQFVYWQQRSAISKQFAFPNERDFGVTKGQFIYNFDNIEPASYAILTEAIFGCISLGAQCGATGGADITDTQIRKLKLLGPKDGIILAPDNDNAGIKSIVRNGTLLEQYGFTVLFSLPPEIPYESVDGAKLVTKDWNELYQHAKLSFKQIREIFENGIMMLNSTSRFKLHSLASRQKYASKRINLSRL